MLMKRYLLAGAFLVFATTAGAAPITVGEVTFPQGASSFADAIVTYTPGFGVGVSGSQVFDDPQAALGVPDYNGATGAVSLGSFVAGTPASAQLVVRFSDNSLTTSGDSTPDLHIFEVGTNVESFFVAISLDGTAWLERAAPVSGQPTSIDIDALPGVVLGAQYSYVRLRDDPDETAANFPPFAGPDIDAIGAISSTAPVPVPEPSTLALLGIIGLAGLRRRRRA